MGVKAVLQEIEREETAAMRNAAAAIYNSTNALEAVSGQMETTRMDIRRLQLVQAQLTENERILSQLEGSSMFDINDQSDARPLPPKGSEDRDFPVTIKRHFWHTRTLRCSDAMVYILDGETLEDCIPYSQLQALLVLQDSIWHAHKNRLELTYKSMREKGLLSCGETAHGLNLESLVRCIYTKASHCGVRLVVKFEEGIETEDCFQVYIERGIGARYLDAVEVSEGGLQAEQAKLGLVDAPGLGGGTAFQEHMYDMVTTLGNVASATSGALTAHNEDLETERALIQELNTGVRDQAARLEKQAR